MGTIVVRRLGKALGIIARREANEIIMHEDVDAWYAPSECHQLVGRGENQRRRQARRHAKAESGLSRCAFNRTLRRLPARILETAIARIYVQRSAICVMHIHEYDRGRCLCGQFRYVVRSWWSDGVIYQGSEEADLSAVCVQAQVRRRRLRQATTKIYDRQTATYYGG